MLASALKALNRGIALGFCKGAESSAGSLVGSRVSYVDGDTEKEVYSNQGSYS